MPVYKTAKADSFVDIKREEMREVREKLAVAEKKDLPGRLAGIEDINANFRPRSRYIISIMESSPSKKMGEFYPIARENYELFIEMDRKIMEGLLQLKDDSSVKVYMRKTVFGSNGLYGNEESELRRPAEEKLLEAAHELIPKRVEWLEQDIHFAEADLKLIRKCEGILEARGQEAKLKDHVKGRGFFERAMKTQDSPTYTSKVYSGPRGRHLYIPDDIVSKMKLEYKTSVRWSREGNSLVMSVLPETTAQVKGWQGKMEYVVPITKDMMVAGGLKSGDYVNWSREGDKLLLRKTESAGMDARRIFHGGFDSARVSIPKALVGELKLDNKTWGLLTFDKDGLCLEFEKENSHIASIANSPKEKRIDFTVTIPLDMGWIKNRQEVILEVREGKLYVTAKE